MNNSRKKSDLRDFRSQIFLSALRWLRWTFSVVNAERNRKSAWNHIKCINLLLVAVTFFNSTLIKKKGTAEEPTLKHVRTIFWGASSFSRQLDATGRVLGQAGKSAIAMWKISNWSTCLVLLKLSKIRWSRERFAFQQADRGIWNKNHYPAIKKLELAATAVINRPVFLILVILRLDSQG